MLIATSLNDGAWRMAYRKILTPLQIGRHQIKNRVIMAPLVRARCDEDRAPTDLVSIYYAQRSSAGLIITEGTHISEFSVTRRTAAAHYTDKQNERWGHVVRTIHDAGGIVFQQLYHVGRKALLSTLPAGQLPIAPSAVAATGGILVNGVLEPFPVPRALDLAEIPRIVDEFYRAAVNAREAGFDGVEILAANGFLLDQFLRDATNRRTDAYGGPIENRARFLLEVIDAAIKALGPDRVGIRLSPHFRMDGSADSDPVTTFLFVVQRLNERRIAYIHLTEGLERDANPFEEQYLRMLKSNNAHGPSGDEPFLAPMIHEAFKGPLILNGGYNPATATAMVEEDRADAVSFGRLFIANPDLPERIRTGAELNAPDPSTFFAGGPKGYIDYPFLDHAPTAIQADVTVA
jgi:N-ethylmaleimide reductase